MAAAEMEEMNDFRQVTLSIHYYYDAYRKFPFKPRGDQSAQLSWRGRQCAAGVWEFRNSSFRCAGSQKDAVQALALYLHIIQRRHFRPRCEQTAH